MRVQAFRAGSNARLGGSVGLLSLAASFYANSPGLQPQRSYQLLLGIYVGGGSVGDGGQCKSRQPLALQKLSRGCKARGPIRSNNAAGPLGVSLSGWTAD
jgi:hypothetical protein